MKKTTLLILLLSLLVDTLIAQKKETWNFLTINEDAHIKVVLKYASTADISQSDWLQLLIENKSNQPISIKKASYSINQEKQPMEGEPYINYAAFGRANKYDLFHFYYDLPNPSDHKAGIAVPPNSTLSSWVFLSNYASVLLDPVEREEVCALYQSDISYEIEGSNKKLENKGASFCFNWINSEKVQTSALSSRLRELLLTVHYRQVNVYVISALMKMEEVVRTITDEELIQAIPLRKQIMNRDESILFLHELSKRKVATVESLTAHYKQQLKKEQLNVTRELVYYWDSALFSNLLNSAVFCYNKAQVLEMHAPKWSSSKARRNKVFSRFKEELAFNPKAKINKETISTWNKHIKTLSISRSDQFIQYLTPFLENKTEYEIEDWSKYASYGILPKNAQPDIITVRVCDIAFVAMLRALDQIEIKTISHRQYSLRFKTDILSPEIIHANQLNFLSTDIGLHLFEKHIKLTDDLLQKTKARIKTLASG